MGRKIAKLTPDKTEVLKLLWYSFYESQPSLLPAGVQKCLRELVKAGYLVRKGGGWRQCFDGKPGIRIHCGGQRCEEETTDCGLTREEIGEIVRQIPWEWTERGDLPYGIVTRTVRHGAVGRRDVLEVLVERGRIEACTRGKSYYRRALISESLARALRIFEWDCFGLRPWLLPVGVRECFWELVETGYFIRNGDRWEQALDEKPWDRDLQRRRFYQPWLVEGAEVGPPEGEEGDALEKLVVGSDSECRSAGGPEEAGASRRTGGPPVRTARRREGKKGAHGWTTTGR